MTVKKKSRIQARNEEIILKAARTVFSSHGYKAATMEKIAELSDMSQPNLHHYFKTKADLYSHVLNQTIDTWIDPLSTFNKDGDPREEIGRYIAAKLELSRQSPEASRMFTHEILDGATFLDPSLKGKIESVVTRFSEAITAWTLAGKIREVDPRHLLLMLWATTQHYADFATQVKMVMGVSRLTKADFEAASKSICDIVFAGILVTDIGSSRTTPC